MTRLYLDTEFNGFGGELISMALVSPTKVYSWYGIRSEATITDPWVKQNVIPKLHIYGAGAVMTDREFRESLHNFLRHFDDPEIICDWCADGMLFCQWLHGQSYDSSLDYACRITILKTPPGVPAPEEPHNALADAEALMRWNEARREKNPRP